MRYVVLALLLMSLQQEKKPVVKSLLGVEYYEPERPADVQRKLETDMITARHNWEADHSEEHYIWYGRRLAYLSRFPKAIEIYKDGIKRYPDSYILRRHLGHRYITTRKFLPAWNMLSEAEKLMPKDVLEVEMDGVPNKLNKPLSTVQFNVYYHLALAHYLLGEFGTSELVWKQCLEVCQNDDSRVAVIDWLYMTLRRQRKHDEAKELLNNVTDSMEIIENDSYYERLKMYKNGTPLPDPTTPLEIATLGYGLGNWYLYNGDTARATGIFKKVVAGTEFAAFGFIAAEAELKNMQPKKSWVKSIH